MLNRSHNPFLFPFNPFPLTPSHPPPPPITATQKMEFLEGGLKMDDFLVNYGQTDAVGQDFFVEDLLVDGGDGFFEAEPGTKHECETEDKNPLPLKKTEPKAETEETKANTFGDFGAVSADDVAELEWLSNFVEDSFSGHSMMCQVTRNQSEPVQTSVPTPVQTKARTKRARTGGRIWSSQSLSQSSSSTSSSTESDAWLIYSAQTADSLHGGGIPPPPAKKRRRRLSAVVTRTGQQTVVQSVPRRCSHCGVQKTPQWRAGPNGAKTLCNACGVRYKSGRLFPEYRPACSPTFSSDMHSNNHRKVLEMRLKKDSNLGFNQGF